MASIKALADIVESILKDIRGSGQAFRAEESLHICNMTLIGQEKEDGISSAETRTATEIEALEKRYDDIVAGYQQRLTAVVQNEKNLESYYSRSEIECYSYAGTRGDLAGESTDSLIRELSGMGDLHRSSARRRSQRIVGELFYRFDQDIERIKAEIIRVQAERQRVCQNLRYNQDSTGGRIENEYQQKLEEEEQRHLSAMNELREKTSQLADGTKNRQLKEACDRTLLEAGGWEPVLTNYVPPAALPKETLLGRILYPVNMKDPTEDELALIRKIPNFVESKMGIALPYAVAADHSEVICYECPSGMDEAAEVFRHYILRQINGIQKGTFQAIFFDPINRGRSLGSLMHLTRQQNGCGVCELYLSGQEMDARLENLVKHIDDVNARLNVTNCRDIDEYNAKNKENRIPYISLAVMDYPAMLDTRSLNLLRIILEQSDRCGISVLIAYEKKTEDQAFALIDRIQKKIVLTSGEGRCQAEDPDLETAVAFLPMKIDAAPKYLEEFNSTGMAEKTIDNSFSILFKEGRTPEAKNSTKGLDIPFAIDKNGELLNYSIGYDKSAHGFISGGTGAGKTVLINTLITSAILYYSPDELQLWLVDYKVDEFAFYTRHCPKQVRYVITDKSDDITFGVIDEIENEINRRQKLFDDPDVAVADYKDYRKKKKLPRILVIIDEFHRMSQIVDNDLDYKNKLANIFREARSHGISLLLSDQGITGLHGLTGEAKAQISARIAMRHNEVLDIEDALGVEKRGLDDAAKNEIQRLTAGKEGAFIYRKEIGSDSADTFTNQVHYISGRALYLQKDDEERAPYVKWANQINAKAESVHDFFTGRIRKERDRKAIAQFEREHPICDESVDRIYLGTPLGVQKAFYIDLKNQPDEDLLVVGRDEELQFSLAQSVIGSALDRGYRVAVLVPRNAPIYKKNRTYFESIPNVKLLISFPEMCQYIGNKADETVKCFSDEDFYDPETDGTGEKTLVVWLGTDAILEMMQKSRNTKQKALSGTDPHETANDPVMDRLLKEQEDETQRFRALLAGAGYDVDGQDELPAQADEHSSGKEDAPEQQIGYNATNDVKQLIKNGSTLNLHSVMIVERINSLKGIGLMDYDNAYFAHRIALPMSSDEAGAFMNRTRTMDRYMEGGGEKCAFYSYNKGRIVPFLPYLIPGYGRELN